MRKLHAGWYAFLMCGFMIFGTPWSGQAASMSPLDQCLLEAMSTAGDDVTIGELRQRCITQIGAAGKTQEKATDVPIGQGEETDVEGAVDERLAQEKRNVLEPFTLMSHRPNYILFASYTSGGLESELYQEQFEDESIEFDDVEARFQFSIKFPLGVNLFDKPIDIYAAYTNRSFWQVYNDERSSPFRETNHEPEAWIQYRPDWELFGFRNNLNAIGFNHQSNGRGASLTTDVISRSWNRVFANFVFEKPDLFTPNDTFALSIKPWIRIEEDEEDDDNPDIDDFLGYGRLQAAYKWRKHVFSLMLRNHLTSSFSKGAVELAWSFPIWKYPYLKGYVQWFNGYGESLIDYDQHRNTIGIGVLLTDWL